MHEITVPIEQLERWRDREGISHEQRALRFAPIEAARTALLVIDMQNAFATPGQPIYFDGAESIIPNINRLAQSLRDAGGTIIWVRQTFRDDEPRFAVPEWRKTLFPRMHNGLSTALARGSYGYQLREDCDVRAGDLIIDKTRWGALMPNSSELQEVLQQHGIDTVIVAGLASDACVETTAREAAMLDYKTLFVMDASGTDSDARHNAAITTLEHLAIVDLVMTDALIEAIAGTRAAAAT